MGGAVRQGLEAEGTRPGERIEHAGIDQWRGAVAAPFGVHQHIEQCFARAGRRRPGRETLRRREGAAAVLAPYDLQHPIFNI